MKSISDIEKDIEAYNWKQARKNRDIAENDKTLMFYNNAKTVINTVPADVIKSQLNNAKNELAKITDSDRIEQWRRANHIPGFDTSKVNERYNKKFGVTALRNKIKLLEFICEDTQAVYER